MIVRAAVESVVRVSCWGPSIRDGSSRGYDDCLMSLALMVLRWGKSCSHRSRQGG